MGYTHGTDKNALTRICTKCNKELPNTSDYFCYADKKSGRLESVCKECKAKITKERSNRKIQENKNKILGTGGFKICISCGKELPDTKQYFSIDLTCNSGLRNVCRCCSSNHKNYLPDNYIPSERWSDEDYDLLKSVYKDYTNEELVEKFFPNRTKHALDTQADKGGFAWKTEETYKRSKIAMVEKVRPKLIGRKLTLEQCIKISERQKEYYKTHHGSLYGKIFTKEHREKISVSNKERGYWKGNKNPRHINPLNGELNGNWQGGITNLYQELRSDTKEWQEESMKFCNYKCIVTDSWFDNVHHPTPFKNIIDETFNNCNLDKRNQVLDYTDEEFLSIRNELKSLHSNYGYGICLCKDIHKLFHDNYGYLNNTPYQFLDFVYRLDVGEFDEWLKENKLQLHINYQIIDYLESSLLLKQTA